MVNTSLYRAKLYIKTNSGSSYLYNTGTNWQDNELIDDNIKDKMKAKGFWIDYRSIDSQKAYYFIDLNPVVTISSADLTTVDLANIVSGNTFTITSSGTGTKGYWADLIAAPDITVTITNDISNAKNDFDLLVTKLNEELNKTQGVIVGGIEIKASHFYEFFRFSEKMIGFKTKTFYTSKTTTEYNFQLTDVIGTTIANGLKLSVVNIAGLNSFCQEDLDELQIAVSGGGDIDLTAFITDTTEQPSYQVVKINGDNVSESYVSVQKIPETFYSKGI